jgi:hypothetical protein
MDTRISQREKRQWFFAEKLSPLSKPVRVKFEGNYVPEDVRRELIREAMLKFT